MNKAQSTTVLSCVGLLLSTALVFGHAGATGIVKERMDSMKAIAGSMKEISLMIRHPETFDKARALAAIAHVALEAEKTRDLYPEGSLDHPTQALPAIWQKPERFQALSDEFESRIDDLSKAATNAQTSNDLIENFKAAGSTCSACHSEFRLKK